MALGDGAQGHTVEGCWVGMALARGAEQSEQPQCVCRPGDLCLWCKQSVLCPHRCHLHVCVGQNSEAHACVSLFRLSASLSLRGLLFLASSALQYFTLASAGTDRQTGWPRPGADCTLTQDVLVEKNIRDFKNRKQINVLLMLRY